MTETAEAGLRALTESFNWKFISNFQSLTFSYTEPWRCMTKRRVLAAVVTEFRHSLRITDFRLVQV